MSEQTYLVNTKSGPVRGLKRVSTLNDTFYSFRGIPYAKPPVGDLRFKDPEPIAPWTEPRDATTDGPGSISFGFDGKLAVGSSEDCLYLNVYSKDIKPEKPLPVLVWIHGGGFKIGSGSENGVGPEYLLQKDVVYVSFNYRLGALGYISFDDSSLNVPGNAALKDQALALKWVRENIQLFGGDNKNVTVFGVSSGGASVHAHMISDFSKGLFDKAIVMSGSAILKWCNVPRNNWAARMAKSIGWNGDGGDKECYEYLKNADPLDILKAQETIATPEETKNHLLIPFAPGVEPYVAKQSFFTKPPSQLYKTAWSNSIPLIIGCTADEGLMFVRQATNNPDWYENEDIFERLITSEVENLKGDSRVKELANKLKSFYYGETKPSRSDLRPFLKLYGDKFFTYGMHLVAKGRLESKSDPTYLYRFAFQSETGFTGIKLMLGAGDYEGVIHGEDIAYLFKTPLSKLFVYNSIEHKVVDRYVGSFVQFATTGDPNGAAIKETKWLPIENGSSYKVLNFTDKLEFIELPESKNMQLWDSFKAIQ